jgi:hypothetical protein
MYVLRNIEVCSRTDFYRGEASSITYSECVSVFVPSLSGIQDAPLLRSAVARMTLQFSTVSHKQQDFREKITEYIICFMILSTNFV